MIEEDFYATVKLKTGEEIFAKVAASEEEDKTFLLLSNPITVSEVKNKIGIIGYKIEPWLKTTSEDMFVINKSDVLTMSESSNIEMIMMYQNFVKDSNQQKNVQSGINRRMGYLVNVSDTKKALEKIFKSS